MEIDDLIVLDDNRRYTLLQSTEEAGEKYYLAIGVDEEENPDYKDMVIFKECNDDDGIYVETVTDESLINKLSKIFEKKLVEEVK